MYVDVEATELDECTVSIYDFAGQVRLVAKRVAFTPGSIANPRLMKKRGTWIQEGRRGYILLRVFSKGLHGGVLRKCTAFVTYGVLRHMMPGVSDLL